MLVVPGGGPFADVVREADRRHQLSDTAAHWMAVLAMDQYGYLLSDLIPHSQTTRNLREAHRIVLARRIPVLLPFNPLHGVDPLPHDWAVTSDSISAWVAETIGAPRLILLKDVDGLYRGVHAGGDDDELLESVTMEQLSSCQGVDPFLATVLGGSSLNLWIINGNEPHRLKELLSKGKTLGTCLQR